MNITDPKQAHEMLDMITTALLCARCHDYTPEQKEEAVRAFCFRHKAEPSKFGWRIDFMHRYQWPSTHKMMDNALLSGKPYTFLLTTYNTTRKQS